MKKILIGLAVLAAASAQAQSSSKAKAPKATTKAATAVAAPAGSAAPAAQTGSSVSAASSASMTSASASAAPAGQSMKTTVSEASGGILSKITGEFSAESAMGVKAQQDKKSDAPVMTAFLIGAGYKVTPKVSMGFQQLAYTRTNTEGLEGSEIAIFQDNNPEQPAKRMVMNDFVLKAGYKSDVSLLGSQPISFGTRYYLPTSTTTQALKRDGTLRGDASLSWVLNTRWNLDVALSPRITFNKPESSVGSDAIYRMVTVAGLTYNLNDIFSMYSAVTGDQRSVSVGRGKWDTERLNVLTPELGANITVGKLTINPALTSDGNLSDGSGSVATADSRYFSPETSSYNLNFYATF